MSQDRVDDIMCLLSDAEEYRCTARPIVGNIHAGKWLACVDWTAEFQFENESYEHYYPEDHDHLVFDTFLAALEYAVKEHERVYKQDALESYRD